MFELQPNPLFRAALIGFTLACVVACGGDGSSGRGKGGGQPCAVENVRVELVREYRSPSGKTLPIPLDPKDGHVEGATGQVVVPPPGQPGRPSARFNATGDVVLAFSGPHELAKLESLAFGAWLVPQRAVQARVLARSGDKTWEGAAVGPLSEAEGWQLYRAPLPAEAVQAAQVDELQLKFTGDVAGELALEAPALEWSVAPPWKPLLEGDLTQPRAIQLSNGTRSGYALTADRVLRAQVKLPVDGGHIAFAHSSIEPARGKPSMAFFAVTIRHADGRVAQIRQLLETRNKWLDAKPVAFQGKAGETIEIAIELVVEGPAALCGVVSDLEVSAP